MNLIRNDWQIGEIKEIYNTPLLELIYRAASIHRQFHEADKINLNTLISIKTGACVEDCAYCSQSARYNTDVEPQPLMKLDKVLEEARRAKANGVPRVCLSASWRSVPAGKDFENVLEMIQKVREMGMKVCCTLGMISTEQAKILANAGISAYNHNLDTSEAFYDEIITTRTYKDRLNTLNNLQEAGVSYCSGGIIGMGETVDDRISMIHTLATMKTHPYTVPLNILIPISGTPLENKPCVPVWDMIRLIATTRIVMPKTVICLAAGRVYMNDEAQALCFMAGANSIFIGDKLLTTENPDCNHDVRLLDILGLKTFEPVN